MPRSRDVRAAIRDALLATEQFDSVLPTSPEDFGVPASAGAVACVEPLSGKEDDRWDDDGGDVGVVEDEVVQVTILHRNDADPEARDDGAERLLNILKNAVNGKSLAGLTMPDKTRVSEWRFLPARHPERRVVARVAYWFLQHWDDNDETP